MILAVHENKYIYCYITVCPSHYVSPRIKYEQAFFSFFIEILSGLLDIGFSLLAYAHLEYGPFQNHLSTIFKMADVTLNKVLSG